MGSLVNTGTPATCPHNGQVQFTPVDQPSALSVSTRVRVIGQPIILADGSLPIAGCSFTLAFGVQIVPSPCVRVRFNGAGRVRSQGRPVVLADSGGTCSNMQGADQGPCTVAVSQVRVRGL